MPSTIIASRWEVVGRERARRHVTNLDRQRRALIEARYRLRDPATGQWLHLSGTGLTPVAAWAWDGSASQLEAIRKKSAEAAALTAVTIIPQGVSHGEEDRRRG